MSKLPNQPVKPSVRFYGDLLDWVTAPISDQRIVERSLPEPTSVKDLIEGCGIPHTEVDLILIYGKSVDFSCIISGNEQIRVYPFFKSLDLPESMRLQERKPRPLHFLVDVNLGKLAKYLRLAGFDTAYSNNSDDSELITQMEREDRILLSRDRKLLMRNAVKVGYLPRSDDSVEQLEEVFTRFDLFREVQPFTRCVNCNGVLEQVPKESVVDKLEPLTKKHFQHFSQCPDCKQVYWKGSHRNRLDSKLERLLNL